MGLKIIAVDDEKEIVESLQFELENFLDDFKLVYFESGLKAIEYIINNKTDLVFTDIAMPDMDGHELFTKIKEMNSNIPVILMTGFGYDPNHVVVKCKAEGSVGTLFKPFISQKVGMLLKKALGDKL